MALESTQDYVSYMLQTYGRNVANATAERAILLNWLQAAEQELWIAAPWSFRRERQAVSFTPGTYTMTIADAQSIFELFNHLGSRVDKIPYRSYLANYGASAAAALVDATEAPTRWTILPRETSTQLFVIQFWPCPTTGQESGAIEIDKKAAVLTDASTSFSGFPEDMRIVVALKGLRNMARHQGQLALDQAIDADLKAALTSIAGADRQLLEAVL